MKLGAEKEELEEEVVAARERMAAGEAPTEDAEREWYRLERTRMVAEDLSRQREEDRQTLDSKVRDPHASWTWFDFHMHNRARFFEVMISYLQTCVSNTFLTHP